MPSAPSGVADNGPGDPSAWNANAPGAALVTIVTGCAGAAADVHVAGTDWYVTTAVPTIAGPDATGIGTAGSTVTLPPVATTGVPAPPDSNAVVSPPIRSTLFAATTATVPLPGSNLGCTTSTVEPFASSACPPPRLMLVMPRRHDTSDTRLPVHCT